MGKINSSISSINLDLSLPDECFQELELKLSSSLGGIFIVITSYYELCYTYYIHRGFIPSVCDISKAEAGELHSPGL
jgi:glucan phosphoethanolaminetransferase (alkaline phosphatase superfamily)